MTCHRNERISNSGYAKKAKKTVKRQTDTKTQWNTLQLSRFYSFHLRKSKVQRYLAFADFSNIFFIQSLLCFQQTPVTRHRRVTYGMSHAAQTHVAREGCNVIYITQVTRRCTGGPSSLHERGRDSCLREVLCYKQLFTKACMGCKWFFLKERKVLCF